MVGRRSPPGNSGAGAHLFIAFVIRMIPGEWVRGPRPWLRRPAGARSPGLRGAWMPAWLCFCNCSLWCCVFAACAPDPQQTRRRAAVVSSREMRLDHRAQRGPLNDRLHRREEHVALGRIVVLLMLRVLVGSDRRGLLPHLGIDARSAGAGHVQRCLHAGRHALPFTTPLPRARTVKCANHCLPSVFWRVLATRFRAHGRGAQRHPPPGAGHLQPRRVSGCRAQRWGWVAVQCGSPD